jgi:hypothetical protein
MEHLAAAVEKSVVPARGVPAPDAPSPLPGLLQCLPAGLVSRAPYIPDAARSAARSFSAAAFAVGRTQPVLPAGRPWSEGLVETQAGAEVSLPEREESRLRLAPSTRQPPAWGPREPKKQLVVPEPRTAVELGSAEL